MDLDGYIRHRDQVGTVAVPAGTELGSYCNPRQFYAAVKQREGFIIRLG